MNSFIKQFSVAACLLLAGLSSYAQTAGVIGIKFGWTGSYGNKAQPAATESTGVVPMTNWMTLLPNFGSGVTAGLSAANPFSIAQDSAGNALYGVTLTEYGINDAWYNGDSGCANGRLMYDFWKFNTSNGQTDPGGKNYARFVVANLPVTRYDVYVYINDNNNNYWGNCMANGVVAVGTTVDGGGQNGYNGANNNGTQSACTVGFHTATGYGNNLNYVKMAGVVVTNGVIDIWTVIHGGGNHGVSGIELVPPPAVSIITPPASETVVTNGSGSFSVVITGGVAPFNYQWYLVSGGVTNAIIDGTGTNSVYNTPPATPAMNGNKYFVKVTDTVNSSATSSQATLTVSASIPGNVSIQFLPSDTSSGIALAAADSTGFYSSSNWNALTVTVNNTLQNFAGLKDQRGYGTAVQLTTLGTSDGWRAAGTAPDSAPITKLLNTFVKGRTGNPQALGTGLMQFVLSNLDSTITYNAYVYMLDNSGGNLPNVDGGNGITNYAGTLFQSVNASSNLVSSANQNPAGPRDSGNYVHLTGLTPTGGAITISVNWDTASTGDGIGVSGLQLVNAAVDLAPVSITGNPASQRVLTNTAATFGASASGSPIFYQWYRISGGTTNAIAGATNSSYTLPSVSDSDSGAGFFLNVSNQFNQTNSKVAILTAGHLVTQVAGFLENDEFNTGAWNTSAGALAQVFPGSTYVGSQTPSRKQYLQTFDDNQDLSVNSSERTYGYFVPPTTGNYIFYVASDDASALWLSMNSDPANVFEIAQNQAWMYHNDWTLSQTCGETPFGGGGEYRSDQFELGGGQNSVVPLTTVNGGAWAAWPNLNVDGSITLTAGQAYYIELDHWQGSGGQAASVTYKLAGQSDPAYQTAPLLAYGNLAAVSALDGDAITITNHPANATALEGLSASFSVTAGTYVAGVPSYTTPPLEYQWYLISGGVTNLIAGANSSSYSTPPTALANSGRKYFCHLTTIAFQTNSQAATLTVVPSNVKPVISEIGGSVSNVFVTWNELLDAASAVNLANYSINGGVTILSATATNIIFSPYAATVVTLAISNAVAGQIYTLTANNIKNLPSSQTNAPNTQAGFLAYHVRLDFNEGAATSAFGLASVNLTGGYNGAGAVDLSIPSGGNGWVLVNDPINGTPVTNFVATFKLFLGPFANNNNGNPTGLGDGVSFNFGDAANVFWPGATTFGSLSDGITNALVVNFKPFNGSTSLGVNVAFAGIVLTNAPLIQATLVNSNWVDVTIQLDANGNVSVDWNGLGLVNKLSTGYTPVANGTFLFGGSCGGFWEQQNLDNISILENAVLPPAAIKMTTSGSNMGISWFPEGGRLQTASSLTGPWTDVGGGQPFTIPTGSGTQFYRVVVP